MHGRNLERPRRAGHEQDGEHALAIEPALDGAHGKRERRERLAHLAGAGDRAAVEQVEHLSGDDRRREQGKELHEADEAEVERIVGERVDLPAHRHPLHHEGAVGERPRAPEANERAVAREGRGGGGGGHGSCASAKGSWALAQATCAGCEAASRHYSGMASSVSISRLSRITTFSAKRAAPSSNTT